MKRKYNFVLVLLAFITVLVSCKKDDDDGLIFEERDRQKEADVAKAEILEYLQTHFYNYEEFENPPVGFDYQIVFDTIGGDNSNKIPLIDQVQTKSIFDRATPELVYEVYYLNAVEGEGESIGFADGAYLNYKGIVLKNNIIFDQSTTPLMFDLTSVVTGFQEGICTLKTAGDFIVNPDNTISFENYGVGAVFLPSALGYWYSPPAGSEIKAYNQIIFTYQLFQAIKDIDHDGDGIPSYMEDLNNNGYLMDDDTDNNGIPNYLDNDDDGDGTLTIDEIIINEDGTIEFPDSNNNGIPDYLDKTYPN